MKIGLKTLSFIVSLLGIFWVSYVLEIYNLEEIIKLQPLTLCTIGAFTTIFCGAAGQLIGQHHASEFYLGISREGEYAAGKTVLIGYKGWEFYLAENRGDVAIDMSLWMQKLAFFPIFLTLTLFLIDCRTLVLVSSLDSMFEPSEGEFCPEEDEDEGAEEIPPGCELVIRAYQLGYTKKLGDCESKSMKKEAEGICMKRQRDEPYLHWTMRQMGDLWTDLIDYASSAPIDSQINEFNRQYAKIDKLWMQQKQSMVASGHSAHHLFTNLEEPSRGVLNYFKRLTESNYCLQEFSGMPNTIQFSEDDELEERAGRKLEFAYGQLLFTAVDQPAAGYCPEFKIHWDVDEDSCDRLAADPVEFLKDEGIYGSVMEVIERRKSYDSDGSNIAKMEFNKDLLRAISFQCFMVASESKEIETKTLTIDGNELKASTIVLVHNNSDTSKRVPVDFVHGMSQAMVPHFRYSAYLSNQKLSKVPPEKVAEGFDGTPPLFFSYLEKLRKADIMLEQEWLQDNPGVLEVYPCHREYKSDV